jgi:hypothetical protein
MGGRAQPPLGTNHMNTLYLITHPTTAEKCFAFAPNRQAARQAAAAKLSGDPKHFLVHYLVSPNDRDTFVVSTLEELLEPQTP